jgi:hypothetical protein
VQRNPFPKRIQGFRTLLGEAPERPCSIGASGWCAASAEVGGLRCPRPGSNCRLDQGHGSHGSLSAIGWFSTSTLGRILAGSSLDIVGSSVMSLPPRQRYLPRSCRAGSCANMMVAEISTGLRDEEGSMKLPQTGGRQREKVRYEITEEPQSVYTCHCLIANA